VPLSEHEQRQLEQIEQALYAEHPRFVRAVRAADPKVHYKRRIAYAAVGFVIGLALLPVGISIQQIWVSVAGFVVMLACSYWAAVSYRRMTGIATGRVTVKERGPKRSGRRTGQDGQRGQGQRGQGQHGQGQQGQGQSGQGQSGQGQHGRSGRRGGKRPRTGLGDRLEERWRRRQEDRGN
jgi:hypothetical protein